MRVYLRRDYHRPYRFNCNAKRMTIRETIASNLKRFRQSAGKRQHEIAQEINVSIHTYRGYERKNPKSTPPVELLVRIADVYRVSIDDILTA